MLDRLRRARGSRARSPADDRARMVAIQLAGRGIVDERVLAAVRVVPREAFVPDELRGAAHEDEALAIEAGQTISQPYIVGRMTELLAVKAGDRVLDIGTGSGYQAAVLAEIGCTVVSIERHPTLAASARQRLAELGYTDRIEVRVGDGTLGDAAGGPWPRILVAAAAPHVPESLRDQLSPDSGRLVIPIGDRDRQELTLVIRNGDRCVETRHGPVRFVPLIGVGGFPD